MSGSDNGWLDKDVHIYERVCVWCVFVVMNERRGGLVPSHGRTTRRSEEMRFMGGNLFCFIFISSPLTVHPCFVVVVVKLVSGLTPISTTIRIFLLDVVVVVVVVAKVVASTSRRTSTRAAYKFPSFQTL